MTNEEAIKVLRTESVEIGGNAVSVARWLTALDVAVKAVYMVAGAAVVVAAGIVIVRKGRRSHE